METNGEHDFTPVYFAFRTLTNTLVRMEEHGPPPRVDRTVLKHMSNQGQTQFISGIRSLGLIDENGNTQDRLIELVTRPDDRSVLFAQILQDKYAAALALPENATTGMLQEVFEGYGVRGDTQRKAIAFFLNAAEYAGIKVSPQFRVPSVPSASGKRRRIPAPVKDSDPVASPPSNGLPKGLHPGIAGMLAEIPPQGAGWPSEARREQFKQAFAMALDFLVPVLPDGSDETPMTEEQDE